MSAYKRTNSERYKLILEQFAAGDPKFKQVYNSILKDQLDSFINSKGGAVYPQYKGTQLEEFKYSTVKDASDIVAIRKEVFETTAQALKIPLPMMYGNITNMDEIVQVFLTFCIDAWADMIGEEMTRKYYSFAEWQKGSHIKVDTSCINHVDILKVADEVSKAIGSGAVNVDELRKRLGYQELDTEFSTSYFVTKNYELAENMLKNDIAKGGE
jgi:HK97 family phage portal protein